MFQRVGDPKPPSKAPPIRLARRLTLQARRWFLSLRDGAELGPFETANAAMTASRELDTRLHSVSAQAANNAIRSFAEEQQRRASAARP
jgi:hypothetical protein